MIHSRHPLYGASQRVDRAEEHLADLQRRTDGFRQDYIESVQFYFEPDPPYRAYERHPHVLPSPRPIVSIVLGEICYNLRSSLDYLIFELAKFDSGAAQENTQFPIDDTPKKFAGHIPSRLKGVSLAHVAMIEELQPYKGCAWTKTLREISNPDKHRMLTSHGQTHIVEIVREGKAPILAHNISAKRRAKRPDGVEVEVELIASIDILVPLATQRLAMRMGFPIEEVCENLIAKVRDLLDAFKPEFK
jgi:hypothetical protein